MGAENLLVRGRVRGGRRALAAASCAALVLLATASGAGARGAGDAGGQGAPGGGGAGWHGPIVTHPGQEDFSYPRGEVCSFPTEAKFPVVDMTQKTWVNDKGDPVFAIVSGPLIMTVKNLDTGKTVRRDISGTGSTSYPDPGSDTHILSGADWGVGLHTSDRPVHNKWLIARGFMSVRASEKNGVKQRELLALEGRYEDLCKTLA